VIVKILIAANVLLFVIGVAMGDGVQGQIVSDGLLIRGVLNTSLGDWYRVVTSGFLHYGFVHLGFNMYALWFLGPAFERSLGRLRFTLFYFAALISGSFGAMVWTPNSLTVGASGAIFGLLGLATVAQRSSGYSIWKSGLGMVLLLNLLLTFTVSSISVGGHLGGFVAGLVAGWLVFELPKKTDLPRYFPEVAITIFAAMAYVGTLLI
jgi:membrane associated rhomboid family serine protease